MYESKYYTCEQIDERLLKGYYDDIVSKGYPGTFDQLQIELGSTDLIDLNILNNNEGYTMSEAISKMDDLALIYPSLKRFRYTDKNFNKLRTFIYDSDTSRRKMVDITDYYFTIPEINADALGFLLQELGSISYKGTSHLIHNSRVCGELTMFTDTEGKMLNQILLTNCSINLDHNQVLEQSNNKVYRYERFFNLTTNPIVDSEGKTVQGLTNSTWAIYDEASEYDIRQGISTKKVDILNTEGTVIGGMKSVPVGDTSPEDLDIVNDGGGNINLSGNDIIINTPKTGKISLTSTLDSKSDVLDISNINGFWYKGQQLIWAKEPCHTRYIYDVYGKIDDEGDYYIGVCYMHRGSTGVKYVLFRESDRDEEGHYWYYKFIDYTSENVPEFVLECFGEVVGDGSITRKKLSWDLVWSIHGIDLAFMPRFTHRGENLIFQGHPCEVRTFVDDNHQLPFSEESYQIYLLYEAMFRGQHGVIYGVCKQVDTIFDEEKQYFTYETVMQYSLQDVPDIILEVFGENLASEDTDGRMPASAVRDIKKLKDDVSNIELFKFPNATIIGEPTIQNGQISGFSTMNYLQFPFILDLHEKAFQIDFCFTTATNVQTQQNILDSKFGLALAIKDGKGLMAISSNGTSWNIGNSVGTMAIESNTTYYARVTWDRLQYKTWLSTDGVNYTQDMTLVGAQAPYPTTIFIGGCDTLETGHTPHPFLGTINLNKATLSVMGNVIWAGMDDAGLATRLATDLSNIDEAGKEKIKEIAKEGYSIQYDLTKNEPLPATLFLKNGAYDESPDKQCWYGQSSCYVNTPKVSNYLLTLAVKVTYEGATVTVEGKPYSLESGKSVSIPVTNQQRIDFLLSNWVWFNGIEVSENAIGILTEEVSRIDESLEYLEDVVNIDESILYLHNYHDHSNFIKMRKNEGIEIVQTTFGEENKIRLSTSTLSFELNDNGQLVIKAASNIPKLALGTSDDMLRADQSFQIVAGKSILDFKKSAPNNFTHPSSWTVDIQGSYQLDAKKGITLNANGGACYIYAGTADSPQKMEIGSKGVSYIQFNKDGNARFYGNVTFKGEVTFINVKEINRDGDITINSKNIKWNEDSVKEIPLYRNHYGGPFIYEHEYFLDPEDGQIIIWSKSNLIGSTIQQLDEGVELKGSFVISESTCAIYVFQSHPEYTEYFLKYEYWKPRTESIKCSLPTQISHNLSQELNDIKELKQVVEDNEKVTAAALLDIHSQINYRDYIRDVIKVTHEAGYDFSEMDIFLSILSYYCLQVRNMPNSATENQKPWSWVLGIADEMDLSGLVYKEKMQFFIPVKTPMANITGWDCFGGCYELIYVPSLNISQMTSLASLFEECYKLVAIGQLNTHHIVDMNSMFDGCYEMTTAPQLDTYNVTNMEGMFSSCHSMVSVPEYDTHSLSGSISFMFSDCFSLKKAPIINAQNISRMRGIFAGSTSLEEFRFLNAPAMDYNNYEFSTCPKLRRDVIVQFFNDLADTGGTRYEIALHHDAYNRLTAEDVAIATGKGYAVYSV